MGDQAPRTASAEQSEPALYPTAPLAYRVDDIGGGLPLDEAAWKQMVAVLTAMKPILVKPSEERTGQMGQAEPVA